MHLVNPAIECNVGYPEGPVTRKVVFLPTEPNIVGGILLLFRLPLLLSALLFEEVCVYHQTVADWLQGKIELHFELLFTAFLIVFFLGGKGGSAEKLWK
jgi:hypothetical protein